MPPKQTRDALLKKQEIATKVKEIKDRQRKWMDEKKLSESGESRSNSSEDHRSNRKYKSPDYRHPTRHKQHSSIEHKPAGSSSPYIPSNYESITPSDSGEESYDLIADNIIYRVKNSLGVTRSSEADSSILEDCADVGCSQPKPLAAHMCYKCRQLMVSPRHSPMMLIPCGHSLCEACCRSAVTCYLCETEISSQTSNIMLQQIIQSKHPPSRGYSGKTSRNTTTQHRRDAMEEEVQTLLLRKEAMEEERRSIEQNISRINQRIMGEVEQISSVEKAEGEIISQISQLQKKLVTLQDHKHEFKEKITSHKSQIDDEKKKVNMINETMQYLSSKLDSLHFQPP